MSIKVGILGLTWYQMGGVDLGFRSSGGATRWRDTSHTIWLCRYLLPVDTSTTLSTTKRGIKTEVWLNNIRFVFPAPHFLCLTTDLSRSIKRARRHSPGTPSKESWSNPSITTFYVTSRPAFTTSYSILSTDLSSRVAMLLCDMLASCAWLSLTHRSISTARLLNCDKTFFGLGQSKSLVRVMGCWSQFRGHGGGCDLAFILLFRSVCYGSVIFGADTIYFIILQISREHNVCSNSCKPGFFFFSHSSSCFLACARSLGFTMLGIYLFPFAWSILWSTLSLLFVDTTGFVILHRPYRSSSVFVADLFQNFTCLSGLFSFIAAFGRHMRASARCFLISVLTRLRRHSNTINIHPISSGQLCKYITPNVLQLFVNYFIPDNIKLLI